jgi:hypothetical protein
VMLLDDASLLGFRPLSFVQLDSLAISVCEVAHGLVSPSISRPISCIFNGDLTEATPASVKRLDVGRRPGQPGGWRAPHVSVIDAPAAPSQAKAGLFGRITK